MGENLLLTEVDEHRRMGQFHHLPGERLLLSGQHLNVVRAGLADPARLVDHRCLCDAATCAWPVCAP